jgi:hypothetical protein
MVPIMRIAFTAGPGGTLLVSNSDDARAIRDHLTRLIEWLDRDPGALARCRVPSPDEAKADYAAHQEPAR